MSTETQNRFSQAELVIFMAWLDAHPGVLKNRANAKMFGDYLALNNLRCTLPNLDQAFVDLKAAGRIEVHKTPAEAAAEREAAEKAKIEAARKIIYADVAAKLAPAKLDFGDWNGCMRLISEYLRKNHGGRMSADSLFETIQKLKRSLTWVVEPTDLHAEYDAWGRRNHAKNKQPEVQETENFGRRNHALDDEIDKELKEGFKKVRKGMDEEEGRRIGAVMDHAIDSYVAVRNGRISVSQTEAVKAALRKYMAKHGSAVLALIGEMPDNDSTEWYIKKRL